MGVVQAVPQQAYGRISSDPDWSKSPPRHSDPRDVEVVILNVLMPIDRTESMFITGDVAHMEAEIDQTRRRWDELFVRQDSVVEEEFVLTMEPRERMQVWVRLKYSGPVPFPGIILDEAPLDEDG